MRTDADLDQNTLRVLSIRQPWAEAILAGYKRIDNRTWRTSYRGLIGIHASKMRPDSQLASEAIAEWGYQLDAGKMQYGALLGVAWLVDVVPIEAVEGKPFAEGPFCWLLEDAVRFERPVPMAGALQIFSRTLERPVRSYLAAAIASP